MTPSELAPQALPAFLEGSAVPWDRKPETLRTKFVKQREERTKERRATCLFKEEVKIQKQDAPQPVPVVQVAPPLRIEGSNPTTSELTPNDIHLINDYFREMALIAVGDEDAFRP